MILHLLIIQVVSFVILLVVLRQIFYKQLNQALMRLQTLHKLNLARETELKEKLDAVEQERDEKLAAARDEADRIISEATAASAKITADTQASAEEKAAAWMASVRVDMERREQALAAQRQQDVLEAALKVVAAAFSARGMGALHAQLVDEAMDELAAMDPARFAGCGHDIRVLSALELDPARQERLKGILQEKTGAALRAKFHEQPDLVAGIRVHVGALTIDGSLVNKLDRVRGYLQGPA